MELVETARVEGLAPWEIVVGLGCGHHGVVGYSELRAGDVPKSQIDSWVRNGRLVAIHRGVYLIAAAVEPPLARHSAALLSCGSRSAIGFWDAARLHSLPLGERNGRAAESAIHICCAGPRRARRQGLRIHHTRTLTRADVIEVEGLRVTSAARTICDLAPLSERRRLERMTAEALYLKLFEEDEFARRVHGSRFPGVGKLRAIVDDPDGPRMTRSEGESILLAAIDAAGLPRPLTQHEIRGSEFDFVWPRERVVLELDRASAHSRARTKQRDDHKSLVLIEAGWPAPIHVTGVRLRTEPDRIVAALAAALRDSPATAIACA